MCHDSSNDKNSDRQGSKNASLIRTKGRRGGERKETARAHFDSD